MSLYHNAVGWSAVCDYGISWSYSLAFCVGALFYGEIVGVFSSQLAEEENAACFILI